MQSIARVEKAVVQQPKPVEIEDWQMDENQIDNDAAMKNEKDSDGGGGDGWSADENGDDDGWDEATPTELPKLEKSGSSSVPFKVMMLRDVQTQIPKRVKAADELLCLENEDHVIAIMRHFIWDQSKINDVWFTGAQDKLRLEIGLDYDQ